VVGHQLDHGTRRAEKTAQDLNDLARRLTETVEQYQL
jgi:hypothetical protein